MECGLVLSLALDANGERTRTKLLLVERSHDSDPFSSTLKMTASLETQRFAS